MRFLHILSVVLLMSNILNAQQKSSLNDKNIQFKKLNDSSYKQAFINTNKSIMLANQALGLAVELQNDTGIIEAYSNLARASYVKSNYDLSLKYATEVYERSKKLNYRRGIGFYSNNMGLIYISQENYKQALPEFKKSLAVNMELKDSLTISSNLYNVSLCHYETKDYDKAEEYLSRSISYAKKHNKSVYLMAINRIAEIDYEKKKYAQAILNYQKALDNNDIENKWEQSFSYMGIARVHLVQNNYTKSLDYALKALQIAEELDAAWDINQIYGVLHEAYAGNLDFHEAYNYAKLYKISNDSLYNSKKDKEINTLQLRRKEAENNDLTHQIELKKQQEKVNKLIIYVVSLIALLLVVLVLMYYFNTKRFKKLNKQLLQNNQDIHNQNEAILKQKKEIEESDFNKDQLFSVIGHDLRSPIVSLVQTVDILRNDNLSIEEIKSLLDSFFEKLTSTATMLDNLLLWANSQKKIESVNKTQFQLSKLTEQLLLVQGFLAKEKNVTIIHQTEDGNNVFVDLNHARIVIQNIISNAIKFTPIGGYIHIHYFIKDDKIGMVIRDTGKGMSEEKLNQLFKVMGKEISTYGTENEKGIGIGLMLVKKFADLNQIEIIVNSDPKGTEFVLVFDSANI